MKNIYVLGAMSLLLTSSQVWAYGSSSSAKSCTKPIIGDFSPADKSTVSKQAEIAFFVAQISNPKSVVATVKQQEINLQVTPKNAGFEFTGKLPADIGAGMARINITAESASKCKATDGWLVNINE